MADQLNLIIITIMIQTNYIYQTLSILMWKLANPNQVWKKHFVNPTYIYFHLFEECIFQISLV